MNPNNDNQTNKIIRRRNFTFYLFDEVKNIVRGKKCIFEKCILKIPHVRDLQLQKYVNLKEDV